MERPQEQQTTAVMKEEGDIVLVLSSDSEDDGSATSMNECKNEQFQRLFAKVQPILFHYVLPGYTSSFFPYRKFKEFAEDIRESLNLVNVKSTKAFIWKNVIRWLLSMKLCYEGILDLKYDERYNLLLTDFMAQYINYKCNRYSTITDETEVCRIVDEILITLGLVFSGNVKSILMTLLKIEIKDDYRLILDPIFRKYLSNRHSYKPNDLISYLRLILCYRQWKKLVHLKEDKELINEIAVGKSEKNLKTLKTAAQSENVELNNIGVLPKMVPEVNETNRPFSVITGLIGFAMNKPFGTRILLINKSLELDETIVKYFQQYEKYICRTDTTLCESTRALRIFNDFWDSNGCSSPLPQPMLIDDDEELEQTSSHINQSLRDDKPVPGVEPMKLQELQIEKQQQQGNVSEHLSMDCDISNLSKQLNNSSLSNSEKKPSRRIKKKPQNRNSDLYLRHTHNKKVIELNSTDTEHDDDDDDSIFEDVKDKNKSITCKKQTNKTSDDCVPCEQKTSINLSESLSYVDRLRERAIAIVDCGVNNNLNESSDSNIFLSRNSPILLTSEEDDDDAFFFEERHNESKKDDMSVTKSASYENQKERDPVRVHENKNNKQVSRIESPPQRTSGNAVNNRDRPRLSSPIILSSSSDDEENIVPPARIPEVPVVLPERTLRRNNVGRPSRKEKIHCIPGEVSSTTLLDCSSTTLGAESLAAKNVVTLEDAREVGTLSAVRTQRRCGNMLANTNYGDISDDEGTASRSAGNRLVKKLYNNRFSKVVEEATSSTSEIPTKTSENVIFSIHTRRTRRSTSSSPCPTRTASPTESCSKISPSSTRPNSRNQRQVTSASRIIVRRYNSNESEVATAAFSFDEDLSERSQSRQESDLAKEDSEERPTCSRYVLGTTPRKSTDSEGPSAKATGSSNQQLEARIIPEVAAASNKVSRQPDKPLETQITSPRNTTEKKSKSIEESEILITEDSASILEDEDTSNLNKFLDEISNVIGEQIEEYSFTSQSNLSDHLSEEDVSPQSLSKENAKTPCISEESIVSKSFVDELKPVSKAFTPTRKTETKNLLNESSHQKVIAAEKQTKNSSLTDVNLKNTDQKFEEANLEMFESVKDHISRPLTLAVASEPSSKVSQDDESLNSNLQQNELSKPERTSPFNDILTDSLLEEESSTDIDIESPEFEPISPKQPEEDSITNVEPEPVAVEQEQKPVVACITRNFSHIVVENSNKEIVSITEDLSKNKDPSDLEEYCNILSEVLLEDCSNDSEPIHLNISDKQFKEFDCLLYSNIEALSEVTIEDCSNDSEPLYHNVSDVHHCLGGNQQELNYSEETNEYCSNEMQPLNGNLSQSVIEDATDNSELGIQMFHTMMIEYCYQQSLKLREGEISEDDSSGESTTEMVETADQKHDYSRMPQVPDQQEQQVAEQKPDNDDDNLQETSEDQSLIENHTLVEDQSLLVEDYPSGMKDIPSSNENELPARDQISTDVKSNISDRSASEVKYDQLADAVCEVKAKETLQNEHNQQINLNGETEKVDDLTKTATEEKIIEKECLDRSGFEEEAEMKGIYVQESNLDVCKRTEELSVNNTTGTTDLARSIPSSNSSVSTQATNLQRPSTVLVKKVPHTHPTPKTLERINPDAISKYLMEDFISDQTATTEYIARSAGEKKAIPSNLEARMSCPGPDLPIELNLRRTEIVRNEEDSKDSQLSTEALAGDLSDSHITFSSGENSPAYIFQTPRHDSPSAYISKAKPTYAPEDQEVSTIISQETENLVFNSYHEDCGTPVLDEKDSDEIESPISAKTVSLSVLRVIPEIPPVKSNTEQISPEYIAPVPEKPSPLCYYVPRSFSKTAGSITSDKLTLTHHPEEKDEIPSTPTTSKSVFVEPSPKLDPNIDAELELPVKERIKRRYSQSADVHMEFPPTESVDKTIDTSKAASVPKLPPNDNVPLNLILRSENYSSNDIPQTISAEAEDQNVSYKEPWLKKLGISKTNNKTPCRELLSPTLRCDKTISPEVSPIKQSKDIAALESTPVTSKNEGRRRKPIHVKKLTDQQQSELAVEDSYTEEPITYQHLTPQVDKEAIFLSNEHTPIQTIDSEDIINAANILSEMRKNRSHKIDEDLTIEPETIVKSRRTPKQKANKQASAEFTRLTRSTSQLIEKSPQNETPIKMATKTKCSTNKKITLSPSAAESIWQQEYTRDILRSCGTSSESILKTIDEKATLKTSSDSDDEAKFRSRRTLAPKSKSKAKTTRGSRKRGNGTQKMALEQKVNELKQKAEQNVENVQFDDHIALTPEVDVFLVGSRKQEAKTNGSLEDITITPTTTKRVSSNDQVTPLYPIMDGSYGFTPRTKPKRGRKQSSTKSWLNNRQLFNFNKELRCENSPLIEVKTPSKSRASSKSRQGVKPMPSSPSKPTDEARPKEKRLSFGIDSILGVKDEPTVSPQAMIDKEVWLTNLSLKKASKSLNEVVSELSTSKSPRVPLTPPTKASTDQEFLTDPPILLQDLKGYASPLEDAAPSKVKSRRKSLVTLKTKTPSMTNSKIEIDALKIKEELTELKPVNSRRKSVRSTVKIVNAEPTDSIEEDEDDNLSPVDKTEKIPVNTELKALTKPTESIQKTSVENNLHDAKSEKSEMDLEESKTANRSDDTKNTQGIVASEKQTNAPKKSKSFDSSFTASEEAQKPTGTNAILKPTITRKNKSVDSTSEIVPRVLKETSKTKAKVTKKSLKHEPIECTLKGESKMPEPKVSVKPETIKPKITSSSLKLKISLKDALKDKRPSAYIEEPNQIAEQPVAEKPSKGSAKNSKHKKLILKASDANKSPTDTVERSKEEPLPTPKDRVRGKSQEKSLKGPDDQQTDCQTKSAKRVSLRKELLKEGHGETSDSTKDKSIETKNPEKVKEEKKATPEQITPKHKEAVQNKISNKETKQMPSDDNQVFPAALGNKMKHKSIEDLLNEIANEVQTNRRVLSNKNLEKQPTQAVETPLDGTKFKDQAKEESLNEKPIQDTNKLKPILVHPKCSSLKGIFKTPAEKKQLGVEVYHEVPEVAAKTKKRKSVSFSEEDILKDMQKNKEIKTQLFKKARTLKIPHKPSEFFKKQDTKTSENTQHSLESVVKLKTAADTPKDKTDASMESPVSESKGNAIEEVFKTKKHKEVVILDPVTEIAVDKRKRRKSVNIGSDEIPKTTETSDELEHSVSKKPKLVMQVRRTSIDDLKMVLGKSSEVIEKSTKQSKKQSKRNKKSQRKSIETIVDVPIQLNETIQAKSGLVTDGLKAQDEPAAEIPSIVNKDSMGKHEPLSKKKHDSVSVAMDQSVSAELKDVPVEPIPVSKNTTALETKKSNTVKEPLAELVSPNVDVEPVAEHKKSDMNSYMDPVENLRKTSEDLVSDVAVESTKMAKESVVKVAAEMTETSETSVVELVAEIKKTATESTVERESSETSQESVVELKKADINFKKTTEASQYSVVELKKTERDSTEKRSEDPVDEEFKNADTDSIEEPSMKTEESKQSFLESKNTDIDSTVILAVKTTKTRDDSVVELEKTDIGSTEQTDATTTKINEVSVAGRKKTDRRSTEEPFEDLKNTYIDSREQTAATTTKINKDSVVGRKKTDRRSTEKPFVDTKSTDIDSTEQTAATTTKISKDSVVGRKKTDRRSTEEPFVDLKNTYIDSREQTAATTTKINKDSVVGRKETNRVSTEEPFVDTKSTDIDSTEQSAATTTKINNDLIVELKETDRRSTEELFVDLKSTDIDSTEQTAATTIKLSKDLVVGRKKTDRRSTEESFVDLKNTDIDSTKIVETKKTKSREDLVVELKETDRRSTEELFVDLKSTDIDSTEQTAATTTKINKDSVVGRKKTDRRSTEEPFVDTKSIDIASPEILATKMTKPSGDSVVELTETNRLSTEEPFVDTKSTDIDSTEQSAATTTKINKDLVVEMKETDRRSTEEPFVDLKNTDIDSTKIVATKKTKPREDLVVELKETDRRSTEELFVDLKSTDIESTEQIAAKTTKINKDSVVGRKKTDMRSTEEPFVDLKSIDKDSTVINAAKTSEDSVVELKKSNSKDKETNMNCDVTQAPVEPETIAPIENEDLKLPDPVASKKIVETKTQTLNKHASDTTYSEKALIYLDTPQNIQRTRRGRKPGPKSRSIRTRSKIDPVVLIKRSKWKLICEKISEPEKVLDQVPVSQLPQTKGKRVSLDCARSLSNSPVSLRTRSHSIEFRKTPFNKIIQDIHTTDTTTSEKIDENPETSTDLLETSEKPDIIDIKSETNSKDEVQRQLDLSINNILGNQLLTSQPLEFDCVPDDIFAGNNDTSDIIETKFYPPILKPEDLMLKSPATEEADETEKQKLDDGSTNDNDAKEPSNPDEANANTSEANSAGELELDLFSLPNSSIFDDTYIPILEVQSVCITEPIDKVIDPANLESKNELMISGNYYNKLYALQFLEQDNDNTFDVLGQIQKGNPTDGFNNSKNDVSPDAEIDFEAELLSYSIESRSNAFASSKKNNPIACATSTPDRKINDNTNTEEASYESVFKKPYSVPVPVSVPTESVTNDDVVQQNVINYLPPVEVSTDVGFESFDDLVADSSHYFPPLSTEKKRDRNLSTDTETDNEKEVTPSPETISTPEPSIEMATEVTTVLNDVASGLEISLETAINNSAVESFSENKPNETDLMKIKNDKDSGKIFSDKKKPLTKSKSHLNEVESIFSPSKLKNHAKAFWRPQSNKLKSPAEGKTDPTVEAKLGSSSSETKASFVTECVPEPSTKLKETTMPEQTLPSSDLEVKQPKTTKLSEFDEIDNNMEAVEKIIVPPTGNQHVLPNIPPQSDTQKRVPKLSESADQIEGNEVKKLSTPTCSSKKLQFVLPDFVENDNTISKNSVDENESIKHFKVASSKMSVGLSEPVKLDRDSQLSAKTALPPVELKNIDGIKANTDRNISEIILSPVEEPPAKKQRLIPAVFDSNKIENNIVHDIPLSEQPTKKPRLMSSLSDEFDCPMEKSKVMSKLPDLSEISMAPVEPRTKITSVEAVVEKVSPDDIFDQLKRESPVNPLMLKPVLRKETSFDMDDNSSRDSSSGLLMSPRDASEIVESASLSSLSSRSPTPPSAVIIPTLPVISPGLEDTPKLLESVAELITNNPLIESTIANKIAAPVPVALISNTAAKSNMKNHLSTDKASASTSSSNPPIPELTKSKTSLDPVKLDCTIKSTIAKSAPVVANSISVNRTKLPDKNISKLSDSPSTTSKSDCSTLKSVGLDVDILSQSSKSLKPLQPAAPVKVDIASPTCTQKSETQIKPPSPSVHSQKPVPQPIKMSLSKPDVDSDQKPVVLTQIKPVKPSQNSQKSEILVKIPSSFVAPLGHSSKPVPQPPLKPSFSKPEVDSKTLNQKSVLSTQIKPVKLSRADVASPGYSPKSEILLKAQSPSGYSQKPVPQPLKTPFSKSDVDSKIPIKPSSSNASSSPHMQKSVKPVQPPSPTPAKLSPAVSKPKPSDVGSPAHTQKSGMFIVPASPSTLRTHTSSPGNNQKSARHVSQSSVSFVSSPFYPQKTTSAALPPHKISPSPSHVSSHSSSQRPIRQTPSSSHKQTAVSYSPYRSQQPGKPSMPYNKSPSPSPRSTSNHKLPPSPYAGSTASPKPNFLNAIPPPARTTSSLRNTSSPYPTTSNGNPLHALHKTSSHNSEANSPSAGRRLPQVVPSHRSTHVMQSPAARLSAEIESLSAEIESIANKLNSLPPNDSSYRLHRNRHSLQQQHQEKVKQLEELKNKLKDELKKKHNSSKPYSRSHSERRPYDGLSNHHRPVVPNSNRESKDKERRSGRYVNTFAELNNIDVVDKNETRSSTRQELKTLPPWDPNPASNDANEIMADLHSYWGKK